jgi:hypothetical protein
LSCDGPHQQCRGSKSCRKISSIHLFLPRTVICALFTFEHFRKGQNQVGEGAEHRSRFAGVIDDSQKLPTVPRCRSPTALA